MSAVEGRPAVSSSAATSHFDPGCVKTLEAIVGAQQKNRSHSLDESFMRGRPSLCTNLVPERPIKWFSHSQDPSPCSAVPRSCRLICRNLVSPGDGATKL